MYLLCSPSSSIGLTPYVGRWNVDDAGVEEMMDILLAAGADIDACDGRENKDKTSDYPGWDPAP